MTDVEIVVSTLKSGGISNVVRVFAKTLQSRNLLTRVTTLQDGYPPEFDNLEINSLEISGHSSNFRKIFVAISRVIKYSKSRNSDNSKVSFCMDPSSFLVAYLGSLNYKKVYVAWCATPKELLVLSDRIIIKYFYSKAKVIIVPSEDLKRDLESINPGANFQVVPNPLTIDEFTCSWPRLSNPNKKSILYLGRFSSEKGVGLIPKLAAKNPDFTFTMVGNGPMGEYLEKEKSSANLINLLIKNWGDPRKYLQECDVLILPSLFESFGLVVLESWMYGKPVVAAHIAAGPRGLICKHGGGSLVRNYEDLDEWVKLINENIENKISDEFIACTMKTYSAENIANTWLELSGLKHLY